MTKVYVGKAPPSDIVLKKAWGLIDYFAKNFPKSSIKIEVKYHRWNKYCITHNKDGVVSKEN